MTRFAALVLLLGLTMACSSAVTTPTVPTVDTYTGTVSPGFQTPQTFTASTSGTVTITATSLTPQIAVGLAVGTLSNSICTATSEASVQQGGSVTGTVSSSGTYCALVYDPGTLTVAVAYTITIAHP
jgi:hypothetical protein